MYLDEGLHKSGKGSKTPALLEWLENDPHLDSSGRVVNRATLQWICLGLGIISADIHCIQFTEDDDYGDAPHYIATSPCSVTEFNKLQDYFHRLLKDLQGDGKKSR